LSQKLPQHVAIVMDGNGRWALARGLPRVEGHRMGVQAVRHVVDECLKQAIPVLRLFTFSSENWSRPSDEIDYLMQLFIDTLQGEMDALHEQGVSVRFLGDSTALSTVLQTCMTTVQKLTSNNQRLILNVVINYGGRWDIIQAAQSLARAVQAGQLAPEDIDETLFSRTLQTQGLPDPDFVIRTSGELRISNFFLWQLAYSEFYFSTVCWPDFNIEEFKIALNSFSSRERRYGTVMSNAYDLDLVHHA
jgi:undecaprenyl diphosphate synthase